LGQGRWCDRWCDETIVSPRVGRTVQAGMVGAGAGRLFEGGISAETNDQCPVGCPQSSQIVFAGVGPARPVGPPQPVGAHGHRGANRCVGRARSSFQVAGGVLTVVEYPVHNLVAVEASPGARSCVRRKNVQTPRPLANRLFGAIAHTSFVPMEGVPPRHAWGPRTNQELASARRWVRLMKPPAPPCIQRNIPYVRNLRPPQDHGDEWSGYESRWVTTREGWPVRTVVACEGTARRAGGVSANGPPSERPTTPVRGVRSSHTRGGILLDRPIRRAPGRSDG